MLKCFCAGILSCLGSLFAKYAFASVEDFDVQTVLLRGIMVRDQE